MNPLRGARVRDRAARARPRAGMWCVCGLVWLMGVVTPLQSAMAQVADEETPIWDRSDEDLRAEGWEVRGQDRAPGSVACGLWATAVSTLWHGWGHRCAGDQVSHLALLTSEGVALALLASAVSIAVLSNDADALNPLWSGLFFAGGTLFASGYLFDLLGTFKGSSRPLHRNQHKEDGVEPKLFFRLVRVDPFELNAVGGGSLAFRYGAFWMVPEGRVDLSGLGYWSTGADTGVKVWRGAARATHLGVGVQGRYEAFRDLSFNVLMTAPYLEFSLDLGALLPHLEELHFVNRVGYGFEFYDWAMRSTEDLYDDSSSIFILESELSLNVLENVNFTLAYRQRPDLLVGGLARSGKVWQTIPHPGAGVLGIQLNFRAEQGWGGNVEINLGTLAEFWLGFGRRF